MFKYLFLLVVIFFLVLLPGCGGEKPAAVENNKTAKTASKKVKKTKNVTKKQKTTKAVNEKGATEKPAGSGEKSKPDADKSTQDAGKSEKNIIKSIHSLMTANSTFNSYKYGFSFENPYYGYCKQTIDFVNADIETATDSDKIKSVPKELCAEDGANGKYEGYYFRYIVTSTSVKSDGIENITSYMIVAWPEKVGKTGSKVYITSEQGSIFCRPATAADEGEDNPVTEWPDVDADGSEWYTVAH